MDLKGATVVEIDVHRWYAYIRTMTRDATPTPRTLVIWSLTGDGLASGSEEDFNEFKEREGW